MFLVPGFSFLGSDGRTLGRMAPLRKYTRIEKSDLLQKYRVNENSCPRPLPFAIPKRDAKTKKSIGGRR